MCCSVKMRKHILIVMLALVLTLVLTTNETYAASPPDTANKGTTYTIGYNQGNGSVTFFYPSVVYRENTHTLPVHMILSDHTGSNTKINYMKEILIEERPLISGGQPIQRWIPVENQNNDDYLDLGETSKTMNLYIDIPDVGNEATVEIHGMRYNFGATTPETFPNYDNYTMQLTFPNPIELTVEVVDGETNPPEITGTSLVEYDVNTPPTIEELKATLSASDPEDGDLSDSIQVHYEDYTERGIGIGTKNIHFIVYDSAGNSDYFEMVLRIIDYDPPTIELNGSSTVYHEVYSDYNDAGAQVIDNHDQVRTIYGNNIVDEDSLGTYTIEYNASDASGNTAETVTRTVIVRDSTAPFVVDDVQTISTYNSFNEPLEDLLSDIRVNDNYDGNITDDMTIKTDNYTANMHQPGSYDVVIEVSDSSGNELEHTIEIQVLEDQSPVFTYSYRILSKVAYDSMTDEEINYFIKNLT